MAITTQMLVAGNLVADPELRQTQKGTAVVNFTVATTPRSFNKTTNEWEDGEAVYVACSAWDEFASNIAASLTKGTRVVVAGVMKSRSYVDKNENKRVAQELQVDEIGPSLRYAQASVTRMGRNGKGPDRGGKPVSDEGWSKPGSDWSAADDTPF